MVRTRLRQNNTSI